MNGVAAGARIERIDLPGDEIPTHLADLFARAELENPQFGLPWLRNLSRHSSSEGDSACIFVAYGGENALAALPLYISPQQEARSLGNFYTSLATPITSCPQAQLLLTTLFSHLLNVQNLRAVVLSPLDREHERYPVMVKSLRDAGWSGVHEFFCFGNWFQSIGDLSWESYLDGRPSKLRNTIQRKMKAFTKDGKGSFTVITGGAELTSAIEQYTRIYENSWKNNEPHPEFMPQLIQLAAEKNWLRLGLASLDGVTIASQVWLVAGDTAYIFKLAYDQQFAHHSAGTLLTAHLMQYVIEQDKVSKIDYLSGDDAYKKDWMTERRERFGIAAFNTGSISGTAKFLRYKAGSLAKHLALRDGR